MFSRTFNQSAVVCEIVVNVGDVTKNVTVLNGISIGLKDLADSTERVLTKECRHPSPQPKRHIDGSGGHGTAH